MYTLGNCYFKYKQITRYCLSIPLEIVAGLADVTCLCTWVLYCQILALLTHCGFAQYPDVADIYHGLLHCQTVKVTCLQWRIQRGLRGIVRTLPLPPTISDENEIIWSQ